MLLTRSPLYSPPERGFLVRLACVRRAASVDSEPGSNSRRKVFHHPRPDPKAPPRRRSHRGCRSDIHPESDDFVLHVQPICQRSGPPRIIPRSAYRRPAVPATDEPRAQAMPARNSGSEAQKAPPNRRSSVTLPSRPPALQGGPCKSVTGASLKGFFHPRLAKPDTEKAPRRAVLALRPSLPLLHSRALCLVNTCCFSPAQSR